jgi:hypothetical protein
MILKSTLSLHGVLRSSNTESTQNDIPDAEHAQNGIALMHGWAVGIGIKADGPGIGIPAYHISVRCRSIPVWTRPLFRNRTGSGFGFLFHTGTGLTECRTVYPV